MKHIRQYEIVLEIARRGSISKAAEALGISQPTLSKLLQKTEEQLGLELFDRQSLPLKLTDFGRRYAAAGQRIPAAASGSAGPVPSLALPAAPRDCFQSPG